MYELQKRVIRNTAAIMKANKPQVTLGKLSIEADIDKSYLSKILRGQRRMNLDQLEAIAKSLGVDPSQLLKK